MLSVVIEVLKKSSNLCSFVHLSQIVVWYTATWLYITLHSSSARLDGIFPVQIHLIGIRDSPDHRSVIKRLSLCEFTLWGQDLVSVVRIRESPYYRVYENFVGTLGTVRNGEVSVPRGSTVYNWFRRCAGRLHTYIHRHTYILYLIKQVE